MKIAIMTGLFAKWDVDIDAGHAAKVANNRLLPRKINQSPVQGLLLAFPIHEHKVQFNAKLKRPFIKQSNIEVTLQHILNAVLLYAFYCPGISVFYPGGR